MEEKKKLPLGVQDFAKLIEDDFLYIDKTDLIYDLVHNNQAVFLSRPRRFGKSLLLSTIKYYFLGKKELFKGLAIEKLEEASKEPWAEYPVLYFDFNGQNYGLFDGLDTILENHLKNWEQLYGVTDIIDSPSIRFENIIKAAFEKRVNELLFLLMNMTNHF